MKKTHSFLFIFFLLIHCGSKEPISIQPGQTRCEYCIMQITDMRFNAQVITDKGKHIHFDSIECLLAWTNKTESKIQSYWVKNYLDKNEWIQLEKAVILKSEKIPSPMGASISAYKSSSDVKEIVHSSGGIEMDLDTAKNYIRNEWKNDLMNKR